jgi:hypothetical protein
LREPSNSAASVKFASLCRLSFVTAARAKENNERSDEGEASPSASDQLVNSKLHQKQGSEKTLLIVSEKNKRRKECINNYRKQNGRIRTVDDLG